jgi:STE24 endopeptidase
VSLARAILIALCVSSLSAGVIAFVSRAPEDVRAPQTGIETDVGFTDAQVARHGAYRGPLYLAFGLSLVVQIVALLLLRGRPIAQLISWAEGVPGGWPARTAIVAAVLAASLALVALPIGFVRGYAIQKAWHLSNQDVPAWLLDQAKGVGISLVFAAIAAAAFFAVVRWQPRWWWLWGAGAFTGLTAILVFLFPVVIAPLFNRFTPLDDPALVSRIEVLAQRAGVEVDEVLVADASKRSNAENAYVAGLGATKQVVLYDTLLAGHNEDETIFVVAHELGHEAENHVVKNLAISAVGILAGFAFLAWLVAGGKLLSWAGAGSLVDLRVLPALLLFALLAGLVTQPLANVVSRSFEARADAIAFALIEDPEPAVNVFRRLALSNIADLRPPAPAVWMFYGHPPIADRIAAARAVSAARP